MVLIQRGNRKVLKGLMKVCYELIKETVIYSTIHVFINNYDHNM